MEDESIYVMSGSAVKLLIYLCKKEASAPPDMTGYVTNDTFKSFKTKLDAYPEITAAMKTDGKAYGIVNGAFDDICGADYTLLAEANATAASLALKSLEQGVLVLEDADEDMIEEMRQLLGDELFNELAAKNVQTMELKPQLSIEQQIEQAKRAYYEQKAEAEAQAQAMLEAARQAEEVEAEEVEPLKEEEQ